jgi:hypothetical protein
LGGTSQSTTIHFGGSQVAVQWAGKPCHDMMSFLLGAHFNGMTSHDTIADYRLAIGSDQHALWQGSKSRYQGSQAGKLIEMLMDCVMYDLADRCNAGLMLHAAAVSWNGKGVLLPGQSGAGKSTLATWLTLEGFDYLSDEMVFIQKSSFTMDGFNRPLQHKRPVAKPLRNAIEGFVNTHRRDEDYFENDYGLLIRAEALNPETVFESTDIQVIIFPEYRPEGELTIQKLTPAQASVDLMSSLINARNLEGKGLPEASKLARQIPAYRVTFNNLESIKEEIVSLVQNRR